MIYSHIKQALVAHWVAGAFLPTAYENMKFDKPNGPWASVLLLPNPTEPITCGETGEDEYGGIFQIDLNYPPYKGDGDAIAMADRVRQHFQRANIAGGELVVRIRKVYRSQGRQVDGNYRISITVEWFARVARNVI